MAASLGGIPSASKYTCPCLNVTIYGRQGIIPHTLIPVDPRDFDDIQDAHLSQKIFEGSTQVAEIAIDVGGVRSELELLLATNSIGNWSFFHCLNCKTPTHCIRFGAFNVPLRNNPANEFDVDNYNPQSDPQPNPHFSPNSVNAPHHRVLLNITNMISDPKKIAQLENSLDFSSLFRVIIPTTWTPQRRTSSSTENPPVKPALSPTNPPLYPPGRRLSVNPSPSSAEKLDPTYQQLSSLLQEELRSFLAKEEETYEKKLKEFTDELRKKFDGRAQKARRDRTFLLNLVRSSSLDQSSAVKSLRTDLRGVASFSPPQDDADDVFQKPHARRESAPTRPITIAPDSLQPHFVMPDLGCPLVVGTPPYGGLVEMNRGPGQPPSSALKPITLTLPLPNRATSNNNYSSPRNGDRAHREAIRQLPSSPPAGLFAMDDEEEMEEEEELEDLGAVARNDSPFEADEITDGETDPDDNSLEDLRRTGPVPTRINNADRDRKLSKYSTSAPLKIDVFPDQVRNGRNLSGKNANARNGEGESPLDEEEADDEALFRAGQRGGVSPQGAEAASPDRQIAASMQAIAIAQRDENDPENVFGARPRRRVNTLDLLNSLATARSNALTKKKAKHPDSEDEDDFDDKF